MKIILTVLLSIILLAPNNANAVTCPAKDSGETECNKVEGCGWDGTTCSECAPGSYSSTNQSCQQCPDSYPYSDKGSTAQSACYKLCNPENITDEKGNTIGKREPSDGKAFYNKNCDYNKITCSTPNTGCTGYHQDGNTCTANKRGCSVSNSISGFQTWTGTSWSTCYVTECKEKYEVSKKNDTDPSQMCSINVGTQCTKADCQNELGNCSGNITGEWKWNVWLISKNYSNCKCQQQKDQNNGSFTVECPYSSGNGSSTNWGTSCNVISLISCKETYCEKKSAPGSCGKVPAGHYSGTNDKECHPCPIGSTSDEGSSSIDNCHIITNKTNFCDGDGTTCFYLPTQEPISYLK